MSALDTLRAQHISQGKCGCCWNQVDRDHPNNSRTVCSCGQHEPCDTARLIDDALAEVERLRAMYTSARERAAELRERKSNVARAGGYLAGVAKRERDEAIAERDRLRATIERVTDEVQFLNARDQILIRAALDQGKP